MIQARPEVSLLVLEVFSGGEESREESREEFGEGVRSVCSRLRLWRGRWMVIAHFLGNMKRLRCRKRRASDVPGWRGVESNKGKCSQFKIP